MNKNFKRGLKFTGLALGILFVGTACNVNFCTVDDQAHMLYQFDSGLAYDELGNVTYDDSGVLQFANSEMTSLVQDIVSDGKIDMPSAKWFKALDDKTYTLAKVTALEEGNDTYTDTEVLFHYGYLRYTGTVTNKKGKEVDTLFARMDTWVSELKDELPASEVASDAFYSSYKTKLTSQISSTKTCLTPTSGYFGKDGNTYITGKTWGDAWKKGLIAGLITYPVGWFADLLATSISGAGMSAGWAALCSILVTTVIVRGILIAATFKSTMDQQKMMALQPELSKIQAKYPNSNESQTEKAKMAQEQMSLYKKNGVNPMSSIITMVIQFPIFIGVWGALSSASCLASGSVFGLYLSDSIKDVIFTWNVKSGAFWTAVVLFVLMAGVQLVSSKLPQWMSKKRNDKVAKMGKNPAQDQQNKTMKWMQVFMVIMIIIMGFTLPSGMGVYWLLSGLISMMQTIITQTILNKKRGNN